MQTRQLRVMGQLREVPEGMTFEQLAKEYEDQFQGAILTARQGNRLQELKYQIYFDNDITFLDLTDEEGMRVYRRGISFVMVKAVRELLGEDSLVVIEHSLHKCLYCEVRNPEMTVDEDFLAKLRKKMQEIIQRDLPITKHTLRKSAAIAIAKKQGMRDKAELFRYRRASNINMYEMDGFYDYFYGYMPPSTGCLRLFDLMRYEAGFLIRFPDPENPTKLLPFHNPEKVSAVFMEQMRWCRLMGVDNVAELNQLIVDGKFGELIRINEALHEKKIAEIADQIYQKIDTVKMVLIAGPSSSGKTSFANRLCIQLRVLGVKPHQISLDDYFLERDKTPLDENGKKDFESIRALDLELLNHDLNHMIAGEEVELPYYNFVSGKREYHGRKIRLQAGEILVLEGIHGLNDLLTEQVDAAYKFRVYISAMTQLNIDDHNRISTSDSRLIRRMVRDNQFRGRDASVTINSWNEVTEGEAENIFPFQENADAIFNSATIYELSVLKAFAEPLLFRIPTDDPAYVTAKRLIKFLGYFLAAPEREIPNHSLIKEFIGGSCFKV